MIYLKNEEQIELIRESNRILGITLAEVAKAIQPGVSTLQLDKIADQCIRDHGAVPGCLGYEGFPAALCTSVNDVVVHGIPSDKVILRDGDIITIDTTVVKDGFYGDFAYTFPVGDITPETRRLLVSTKESLYLGIEQAKAGNRLGDIGYAVQEHNENNGYSLVRELSGHGIGREMHEEPEVDNYGIRGNGKKLMPGMVICIEPMVCQGQRDIYVDEDKWTVHTKDHKLSAHYEHCVVIRKGHAELLSSYDLIKEVLKERFI